MIVLYSVFALIALLLITAIFTKKDFTITKTVQVSQPVGKVYDHLRFFKNHLAFNAWLTKDPNIKVTSKNTDGQPGYVMAYEGNKDVGAGEQELTGLEENKKIDIELRFLKPFKALPKLRLH